MLPTDFEQIWNKFIAGDAFKKLSHKVEHTAHSGEKIEHFFGIYEKLKELGVSTEQAVIEVGLGFMAGEYVKKALGLQFVPHLVTSGTSPALQAGQKLVNSWMMGKQLAPFIESFVTYHTLAKQRDEDWINITATTLGGCASFLYTALGSSLIAAGVAESGTVVGALVGVPQVLAGSAILGTASDVDHIVSQFTAYALENIPAYYETVQQALYQLPVLAIQTGEWVKEQYDELLKSGFTGDEASFYAMMHQNAHQHVAEVKERHHLSEEQASDYLMAVSHNMGTLFPVTSEGMRLDYNHFVEKLARLKARTTLPTQPVTPIQLSDTRKSIEKNQQLDNAMTVVKQCIVAWTDDSLMGFEREPEVRVLAAELQTLKATSSNPHELLSKATELKNAKAKIAMERQHFDKWLHRAQQAGAFALALSQGDPVLGACLDTTFTIGTQIAASLGFGSLAAAFDPVTALFVVGTSVMNLVNALNKNENSIDVAILTSVKQLASLVQEFWQEMRLRHLELNNKLDQLTLLTIQGFAGLQGDTDHIKSKLKELAKQTSRDAAAIKGMLQRALHDIQQIDDRLMGQELRTGIKEVTDVISSYFSASSLFHLEPQEVREIEKKFKQLQAYALSDVRVAGYVDGAPLQPTVVQRWRPHGHHAADYVINSLRVRARQVLNSTEPVFTRPLANPQLWTLSLLALLSFYRDRYAIEELQPTDERITEDELSLLKDYLQEGQSLQGFLKALKQASLFDQLITECRASLSSLRKQIIDKVTVYEREKTEELKEETRLLNRNQFNEAASQFASQTLTIQGVYGEWYRGHVHGRGGWKDGEDLPRHRMDGHKIKAAAEAYVAERQQSVIQKKSTHHSRLTAYNQSINFSAPIDFFNKNGEKRPSNILWNMHVPYELTYTPKGESCFLFPEQPGMPLLPAPQKLPSLSGKDFSSWSFWPSLPYDLEHYVHAALACGVAHLKYTYWACPAQREMTLYTILVENNPEQEEPQKTYVATYKFPYDPSFFEHPEDIWWHWVGGSCPPHIGSMDWGGKWTVISPTDGKTAWHYQFCLPVATAKAGAVDSIDSSRLRNVNGSKPILNWVQDKLAKKFAVVRQEFHRALADEFLQDSSLGSTLTQLDANFKWLRLMMQAAFPDLEEAWLGTYSRFTTTREQIHASAIAASQNAVQFILFDLDELTTLLDDLQKRAHQYCQQHQQETNHPLLDSLVALTEWHVHCYEQTATKTNQVVAVSRDQNPHEVARQASAENKLLRLAAQDYLDVMRQVVPVDMQREIEGRFMAALKEKSGTYAALASGTVVSTYPAGFFYLGGSGSQDQSTSQKVYEVTGKDASAVAAGQSK